MTLPIVILCIVPLTKKKLRQEDTSDWLLTDNVSSWPGSPANRGWRYLRVALERHDSTETDYKYSKTAFETILSSDRSSPPPPWLIHSLEVRAASHQLKSCMIMLTDMQENHHEYLIRTTLRYDIIESALEHTLSLLRKVRSFLPLTHIFLNPSFRPMLHLRVHPRKPLVSPGFRTPLSTRCL